MRFCLFTLLLCFFTAPNFAQISPDFPPLKIGEWRQHLPWQRALYVTQSDAKVYFATEWAVVEIDKAERTPRFLTKVEGLSDVGMGVVRFSKSADALVLAYSNSNLDLWYPATGEVVNLPFIRKNTNITGDKKIYDMAFEGKSAYLACGFGILKLNLERAEVEYTTFTDVPVRSFAIYQNYLYAGTEEGLYRLPANDENPADFSRWQLMGALQNLPAGATVNALAVANSQLYIGIDKTLYRYDGSQASAIATDQVYSVFYLTSEGAGLVIGWKKDFDGKVSYLDAAGFQSDIHWTCQAGKPLYAIEDGNRKFWLADDTDDFRYYDANIDQCDKFDFNSPYNHYCAELAIARNKVYVATRGPSSNFSALYSTDGLYTLENGLWSRFNGETHPELTPSDCHRDLWRVAPHAVEDKFYVGSFVGGLVEVTNGGTDTKCYTQYNSILQNAGASGSTRTAISGMAFDKTGHLWICNYDATAPIAVLKTDGTLRNFSAAPVNNLTQVVVDQSGYKWFVVGFNGGVLVYDSGADLDSPSDDRYRLLTTSNSVLPTNTVNCLAVDLDGDVWVGTQQGTVSFECGSNVFDPQCKGSRRIVNVDGFNGYLLETEDVKSIAVDGANRKWFGTTNGIFVQSPSGETQEARFTATNSPLFDNAITDIAINQTTGEAWIGTEKGLISVRSDATSGGTVNSDMPYAYPNPVRPDYEGPIAIYGLARDANVKITDIAGNLVFEGTALGGQAIWNGRDYLGRRAASGVYLIFATSSETFDSPDAVIAKVVILN
ncbi:MAG: hypothetical protein JNL02_01230 [Saprospiraceae bacterium]|nr:hypothetical protein [Saprospiraceae bacterium]